MVTTAVTGLTRCSCVGATRTRPGTPPAGPQHAVAPVGPGLPVQRSHLGETFGPARQGEALLHAARPRPRGQGPAGGPLLVERAWCRDDDSGPSTRGDVGHRTLTGLDHDDRGRVDGEGRVVPPLPRPAEHCPGPTGCVGRRGSELGLGGVPSATPGQDEDPPATRVSLVRARGLPAREGSDVVQTTSVCLGKTVHHPHGLPRPGRDEAAADGVRAAVSTVTAPSRQHDGHDGDAVQARQQGDLRRDVADEDVGSCGLDPRRQGGHPAAQAVVPFGHPVQVPSRGRVDGLGSAVVAHQSYPRSGPVGRCR